jgi:peptidoglycan/xylan/chitin deacetylase (PgdA/CDA1 family)
MTRMGHAERERLTALLDQATARSANLSFWWRDDDAINATPALDRMLDLARRYNVPIAIAVVPKQATQALAERLTKEPLVAVLQHGWRHRNHSPDDRKKAEFGEDRALPEMIGELAQGFDRLSALLPGKFLPVLAPPWNRVCAPVREAQSSVGLLGLSTFGAAKVFEAHRVNTHVDIVDWTTRRLKQPDIIYGLLCEEIERRLAGSDEPIGILTHHLVHESESWDFLDEPFAILRGSAAVRWPATSDLFDLAPVSSGRDRP